MSSTDVECSFTACNRCLLSLSFTAFNFEAYMREIFETVLFVSHIWIELIWCDLKEHKTFEEFPFLSHLHLVTSLPYFVNKPHSTCPFDSFLRKWLPTLSIYTRVASVVRWLNNYCRGWKPLCWFRRYCGKNSSQISSVASITSREAFLFRTALTSEPWMQTFISSYLNIYTLKYWVYLELYSYICIKYSEI